MRRKLTDWIWTSATRTCKYSLASELMLWRTIENRKQITMSTTRGLEVIKTVLIKTLDIKVSFQTTFKCL